MINQLTEILHIGIRKRSNLAVFEGGRGEYEINTQTTLEDQQDDVQLMGPAIGCGALNASFVGTERKVRRGEVVLELSKIIETYCGIRKFERSPD